MIAPTALNPAWRGLVLRTVFMVMLSMMAASSATAEPPSLSVVYPKPNSVVGNKINVVLDPASDWSTIPYFQVVVGGTVSEVIDTSSGRHAIQGFVLQPGMNTVTIKVLANANAGKQDDKGKELGADFKEVLTRHISIFSRVELFTGRAAPAGYVPELFHSRENEAVCSGCHQLEATSHGSSPKKPEEVICFACHRNTPTGRHIHGPAAVWHCLSCHNPDLYPVKYQFTAVDPWKVAKSVQPVVPRVFTLPTEDLFKTASADFTDSNKGRDALKAVLVYLNQNPGERMRIEVHADTRLPAMQKGKKPVFKNNQALTEARARKLAALFKEQGIPMNRFTAVGMGDSLVKSPDTTPEGRELNNRVEIVVYPADVKVVNSQKLPVLTDRKQVHISLQHTQGPVPAKLRVIEKLDKNMQYVPNSSYFRGRAVTPAVKGDEVLWELGDMEANLAAILVYTLRNKSEKGDVSISDAISLSYGSNGKTLSRVFDPKLPAGRSAAIRDVCLKCHGDVMNGRFKHGPVDAGNCTLCHDPHASGNAAWLRKPSWELCTTCHDEKATERHVLTGLKKNASHPTKAKRDPARRGKRLTCVSCHQPHSAESSSLFAFSVKERFDLCGFCHGKKM